tara:strand:- start:3431 stop:3946 length:516 start_codon:yes stop_codon:yes gene_type:complete
MKKVLFLDIDSVLNTYPDYVESGDDRKAGNDGTCNGQFIVGWEYGNTPICVTKLNRLKRIVSETNCDIVGISSWFSCRHDIGEVSKLCDINIMERGYNTIGGMERYYGCEQWLKDHSNYSYAVVLDDIPMDDDFILKSIHVQPFKEGLTEELTDKCIDILNKEFNIWISRK